MRFFDWLLGRGHRDLPKHDAALTASVEQEIARSVATRHQLEKKVVRYYPLIADQLTPFRREE